MYGITSSRSNIVSSGCITDAATTSAASSVALPSYFHEPSFVAGDYDVFLQLRELTVFQIDDLVQSGCMMDLPEGPEGKR